nr:P9 protein [Carrot reovirus 1]
MTTINISERTIAGRKIKIGTSPVWEGILDWFKTGRSSLSLNSAISEFGLSPLEPFDHKLSDVDGICVLPTHLGLLFYVPNDDDRMAMKMVTGPDGKEKRMPNYEAIDIGLAKKDSTGKSMSYQMPWSSTSLNTVVALIPKLIVSIEATLQAFDSTSLNGMRQAKIILTNYFDVQLNFLPQMCQFACACVYLSGNFSSFEHSMIRYIHGQFAAIELIRNRRCDNPQLKEFLVSYKTVESDNVKSVLFRTKANHGGLNIISQLGDDFTLCAEVRQGCAIKLMSQRGGKVSAGDFDIAAVVGAGLNNVQPPIVQTFAPSTGTTSSSPPPIFKQRGM